MIWKKFESIENIKKCREFPEYLIGTVKLHGTNGSVVLNNLNDFEIHSRTQKLSEKSDNHGFYAFVMENKEAFNKLFNYYGKCIIYGEFAGKGINNGAEICKHENKFYIFKVQKDDNEVGLPTIDILTDSDKVKSMILYKTFLAKNIDEVNKFTDEVLKECPICLQEFGASGLGEGIVWLDPKTMTRWKSKWDKPARTKQPKKDFQYLENIVKECCQEWRFEQFMNTDIPTYLKDISLDCDKEVLNDLNLEKDEIRYIKKEINKEAMKFYFK